MVELVKFLILIILLLGSSVFADLERIDLKDLKGHAQIKLFNRFQIQNADGVFYITEKAHRKSRGSKKVYHEAHILYVLKDPIINPQIHLAVSYNMKGISNVVAVKRERGIVAELDGMGVSFSENLSSQQKLEFIERLQAISWRALEMDAFSSDNYATFNWNWNLPVNLSDFKSFIETNSLIEYVQPLVYRIPSHIWAQQSKLGNGNKSQKKELAEILTLRKELVRKGFEIQNPLPVKLPKICVQRISEI